MSQIDAEKSSIYSKPSKYLKLLASRLLIEYKNCEAKSLMISLVYSVYISFLLK